LKRLCALIQCLEPLDREIIILHLQLARQRDARREWRRRPPVVPGLITVLASFVLNPIPWALAAVAAILIVGILSVAVAFEEGSARRLQREIDALDSLVVKGPAH
jgi:hypothetical protein